MIYKFSCPVAMFGAGAYGKGICPARPYLPDSLSDFQKLIEIGKDYCTCKALEEKRMEEGDGSCVHLTMLGKYYRMMMERI